MVDYVEEYSGDVVVLSLGGPVTVKQVGEIKSLLLKALGNSDHVLLNMGEDSIVDLSFLQLMCSAHRLAMKLNKSISFANRVPEGVLRQVVGSGYLRKKGCTELGTKGCLWKMEVSNE